MAYGKAWTRQLAGVALAVAAALAAAGCTSAPANTSGNSQHSQGVPAVTTAEASQAFASYRAAADQAASAGDQSSYLSHLTGVYRATYAAGVRALSADGSRPLPGKGIRYGTPVFYLPASAGYPRWFIADVSTGYNGPARPALTPADGVLVPWIAPGHGRALLLFEQASATANWQLASESYLAPGTAAPALATDGSGHVPTVPLSDTALLSRPDVAGPLQAAVVDEGPASPAARVVASGPLTTGLYHTARAGLLGLSAPPGDVYLWELQGSNYARFALRTADGGALVFYAMYLNSLVEVPAKLKKAQPVEPGPPITVPSYVASLLPAGRPAPRVQLEAQQLLSFATVDPPAGAGKIQVIAIGGGVSYAYAS